MPRTRRVDCNDPGIRRIRRGKGFSYKTEAGDAVTDPDVIARIKALAIPPAWTEVWICDEPRGHIQATGYDDAGRKQYRYHDDWRIHRDRQKFEEMLEFARRLPTLRAQAEQHLAAGGLGKDRVLAAAVSLLDLGLFRIGSARYEEDHGSYGLTTLKPRHVSFERGAVLFDYRSKSGQRSRHLVDHPEVVKCIRALKRRRGASPRQSLLGYRDGRSWHSLSPADVNSWIQESIGDGFTAKDFRTWNATVLAASALAAHAGEAKTPAARKRIAKQATEQVGELLNNTPAVARGSYIDPRVFDCFDSGQTIASSLARLERRAGSSGFVDREAIERAVIRLLK